ncbi:MAG: hypothetical protein ACLP56_05390 [Candidatus Sulfotelmatobacter sp.]
MWCEIGQGAGGFQGGSPTPFQIGAGNVVRFVGGQWNRPAALSAGWAWLISGNLYTVVTVLPDNSCQFLQSGGTRQWGNAVVLSGTFNGTAGPVQLPVTDLQYFVLVS